MPMTATSPERTIRAPWVLNVSGMFIREGTLHPQHGDSTLPPNHCVRLKRNAIPELMLVVANDVDTLGLLICWS